MKVTYFQDSMIAFQIAAHELVELFLNGSVQVRCETTAAANSGDKSLEISVYVSVR